MSAREKKHTPTPWKVAEYSTHILPTNGNGAICKFESIHGLYDNYKENAELIVRAVNAHDDLVKALEKAKEIIKIWHGPDAWEIYDSHSPEMKPINAALALSRSAT